MYCNPVLPGLADAHVLLTSRVSPQDPTADLCNWSAGPREGAFSYERGTPVVGQRNPLAERPAEVLRLLLDGHVEQQRKGAPRS